MSNVFELLHRAGEGSPGVRLDAAVFSAGSLGTFLPPPEVRRLVIPYPYRRLAASAPPVHPSITPTAEAVTPFIRRHP